MLLLYSTVSSTITAHDIDDDYVGQTRINKYVEYRASPPEYLMLGIYLMILGKFIFICGGYVYIQIQS